MKARCRKQEEEVTNPNKRSKLLLLFFLYGLAFPKQTDLDVKIKNPFYGILYSIKEVEKRQRKRQEKKQNTNYTVRLKVVPCEPLGGGDGIVGKFEGK